MKYNFIIQRPEDAPFTLLNTHSKARCLEYVSSYQDHELRNKTAPLMTSIRHKYLRDANGHEGGKK